MSELTVRVDPETGRMVADLSHFLGRTRKAVVRDAVRASPNCTNPRSAAASRTRAAARQPQPERSIGSASSLQRAET